MRNRKVQGALLLVLGVGVAAGPLLFRGWANARSAELVRDVVGASPIRSCVSVDGGDGRALFAQLPSQSESSFQALRTALEALPGAQFRCQDGPLEVGRDEPQWFLDRRRGSPAVWCSIHYYTGRGLLVRGADGASWLMLTETANVDGRWPSREMSTLMGVWC